MKRVFLKRFVSIILVVVLAFSFTGCGEPYWMKDIPIDASGVASWEPVKDAVRYQVDFVYIDPVDHVTPILAHTEETAETFIAVPEGFGVQVRPIFADGTVGSVMSSDYRGEYKVENDPYTDGLSESYYAEDDSGLDPGVETGYVTDSPEADLDKMSTWEVVETLDTSSFKKGDDGYVYFEGKCPSGDPMRFCGYDVELADEGIIFHKNGWMVSLDSIGRITAVDMDIPKGCLTDWIDVFAAYAIDYDMHPSGLDDMCFGNGKSLPIESYHTAHEPIAALYQYESYFMGVGVQTPVYRVGDYQFTEDLLVDRMTIYYNPADEHKPFKKLYLNEYSYGAYVEGEKYDSSKEVYKPYERQDFFELYGFPDLDNDKWEATDALIDASPYTAGVLLYPGTYTIGDVKDPSGKVLDKEKDALPAGSTLEINLGGIDYEVNLPVVGKYKGAKTMHDLVPYAFPSGTGQRNALVIPIAWPDQPQSSTQEVYDRFKSELGRVAELGVETKMTDYSDKTPDNRYSLTSYFDAVSYGKFHLDTYITEWYTFPEDFSVMHNSLFYGDTISQIEDWLYSTYPNEDWTKFDLDKNGYTDTVILLNAGERPDPMTFQIIAWEGAIQYRETYGNEFAGTPDRPSITNNMVLVNADHFKDNTLLHEFSHSFGLIDYYDVSYSGIDAVGGFDMQSSSVGDWNPYSKYSVGWIEPTVVKDLEPGESVDIEIGAFADTGDAIVIPYAGEEIEPPFCEYMMVDLFTDTGVNPAFMDLFDLEGACGVRMYHVDAVMERHEYVSYQYPNMTPCPIGTVHYGNNYKTNGKFNIELIQAGAKNTFTDINNLRTSLQKNDLFKAGDTFTLSKYSQFFDNGLMDFGDDFGYSIKVVSITGSGSDAKAVIRVTRE